MSSRLLDYERSSRKPRAYAGGERAADPPDAAIELVEAPKAPPPYVETTPKGPLDYPAISNWLKTCEDDFERGRDKHAYTKHKAHRNVR